MSIHNTYNLTLINTLTDEVKQKESTTNILTNGFYYSFNRYAFIEHCYIGTGTGEVKATDTKMFKQLGDYVRLNKSTIVKVDSTTLVIRLTFIFPANTTFVGKITELGLHVWNNRTGGYPFISHALLKDAEGHPISIDKSDTDKLIVEVEMHISVPETAGGFCTELMYNYPFAMGSSDNKIKTLRSPESMHVYFATSFFNGDSLNTATFDVSNATVDYSNRSRKFSVRLNTGSYNNKYINYICVPGVGYIKFPNAEIMPNVPLSGLSVGKGDGVTKTFNNPLPLFVKNTDKVYVNGVLQVRGVDYTIDHKANPELVPSVTPGNFIKALHGGYITRAINQNVPLVPFCNAYAYADKFLSRATANSDGFAKYRCLAGDSPLILELDEDCIDTDVNGILLRSMYIMNKSGSTTSIPNLKLKVEYSTDNNVYKEACKVDLTGFNYSSKIDTKFDTVKAKYWKLSLDFTDTDEKYKQKADTIVLVPIYTTGYIGNEPLLYYKGKPITFTNPPAKDAVITMDCELDRPYKTENWVIDFSPEFQW